MDKMSHYRNLKISTKHSIYFKGDLKYTFTLSLRIEERVTDKNCSVTVLERPVEFLYK